MIRLIVAIDRCSGLAKKGIQPWYIPEDEQHFTEQTKTHGGNVLTGSTTFKTFSGPLAGRQNFVLTRQPKPIDGVELVHDLDKFLETFAQQGDKTGSANQDLWVVGGAKVFAAVISAGKADELYITHIDADFGCDQFFPDYKTGFKLSTQTEQHQQNGFNFTYAVYTKES